MFHDLSNLPNELFRSFPKWDESTKPQTATPHRSHRLRPPAWAPWQDGASDKHHHVFWTVIVLFFSRLLGFEETVKSVGGFCEANTDFLVDDPNQFHPLLG